MLSDDRGVERKAERRQKGKLKVGLDIPTREETKAIVEAAKGRWRPILLTAIFTGLRASELRGLRWADIGDIVFPQSRYNLPRDLRSLALVSGREGFVEQSQGSAVYLIRNPAHPNELFIELTAPHRPVFLPLIVREESCAQRGGEGVGGDK